MLSLLRQENAPFPGTFGSQAQQACNTCRKQKRKCDKSLPSCSRCASLQRMCDYSDTAPPTTAPTAEDFASLQLKLAEIEARLNSQSPNNNSTGVQSLTSPPQTTSTSSYVGGSEPNSWMEVDSARESFVKNKFPSILFLDIDMYRFGGKIPPKPTVDVPMEVLEILNSSDIVDQVASTYFNTIHKWFSFISRKRMNLGISLAEGGPDLALLFLTMKLIITVPTPDMTSAADTPLYTASKRFLALLESAGTTSLLYLQSMILVALYEYGHSIYPAAWMTVGNCVRYATMIGLPSYGEASSIIGKCTTWTEAEERRRVWWATYILDRAISLGSKRPFAWGPDLPPDVEYFPMDDRAWDEGDMGRALQRSVTFPLGEPLASPFARLAQASILVTKGMAHCKRAVGRYDRYLNAAAASASASASAASPSTSSSSSSPANKNGGNGGGGDDDDGEKPIDIKDVTQIMTEQGAFCRAVADDMARIGATPGTDAYFAFLPSRCMAWSTAVMVLDLYSCPEHMRPTGAVYNGGSGVHVDTAFSAAAVSAAAEIEQALQLESINGLKLVADKVRTKAEELLDIFSRSGETNPAVKISPLCLDLLYCGLATFQWLWQESGDPDMKTGMDMTKSCIESIMPRWRLAGVYQGVAKQQDVAAMMIMSRNGGG